MILGGDIPRVGRKLLLSLKDRLLFPCPLPAYPSRLIAQGLPEPSAERLDHNFDLKEAENRRAFEGKEHVSFPAGGRVDGQFGSCLRGPQVSRSCPAISLQ